MIHLHRPVSVKEEKKGYDSKVPVTSFLDYYKDRKDSKSQLLNLWNVAQVIKLKGKLAVDTDENFYLGLINSNLIANFGRHSADDQASFTQTYSDSIKIDDH